MQLHSRQRVERFADPAEEYAQWMDERDRCVAIFERHKDVISQVQCVWSAIG